MCLLARAGLCSRMVAVLVVSAAAACSESTESWQDGLSKLEQGKAIFSLMFVGAPPDGSALRIGIHESDAETSCSLYGPEADLSEATPFWYLAVKVGRAESGEYNIVTDMNLAPSDFPDGGAGEGENSDRDHAEVILRRIVDDGEKDVSVSAIGGIVTVIEAPRDSQEWNDGMTATVVIDAEFPSELWTTLECEGTASEEGTKFEGWCSCEDEDGNVTECELSSASQETCCTDTDGPRVIFRKEAEAMQCSWMCQWPMGWDDLASYCQELK